jgi:hypothetical protein
MSIYEYPYNERLLQTLFETTLTSDVNLGKWEGLKIVTHEFMTS